MEIPSWSVILLNASGLYILSLILTAIYNIWFHPLAKFPGPKIAVIGPWYEAYYDIIKDGRYLWQIEKMHEKYGPIVRVNAHELHIKDVTYYAEVYSGSTRKVNKDAGSTGAFGVPTATAATVDHDLHRARRGYITKYFAKRNMSTLEPIVQERLDRLCGRIDERLKTGEPLNLDACFSALTADVITRRFYGNDFNYLGSPDFRFVIRNAFMGFTQMYHLAIFMPLAVKILKSMPLAVIRLIAPPVAELQQLKEEIAENGYRKFHAGKWDAEEKKSDHVYPLAQLEKLPYLTGVIQEGFRLSFGPVSRMPRIATQDALVYNGWTIPPGTAVSMSTMFMHLDETIYPNPTKFDPERWIRATEQGVNLNKYLTTFSKGSRMCLGMNMAYAEFYMTLARTVLTYDMELYNTTEKDIEIHHASIVGYPKKSRDPDFGQVVVKVTGRRGLPTAA
ncbi:benzoate 4-monooxygenase cytochrome P450 [Talaromyces pinophilus]|uniref:Benzoate 4-monooxygenase cytochrome P450 n=1 Tax=Talaromyces pinophilus TaxID=128442 RepID=A0A6V8HH43_TALPI|nr:benzoate 4-monooxygenase cytochrome P450 [Talaromyces pinophilus]